jgi:rod shape-determining protein MreC
MDSLLTRYRNLTVLLVVLLAQLILVAYQVRSNQDVRLIRVWAVTAVTPLARLLEGLRSSTVRFLDGYILLLGVKEENRTLQAELGRLKMENQFLKSELATAERAQALVAFQARTPSRTIAARIIGTGTGADSKVVLLDRGSSSGVRSGMAVVTPDGVVGRVLAAYPTASQVLLITDPGFAAGVVSEGYRVEGTLKGLGRTACLVDYLENEQRVEVGERFYTSGDDRAFPRGLPVGVVTEVRPGKTFKEVLLSPSGLQAGLEEVLVVLEGLHQPIPEAPDQAPGIHLLPEPPPDEPAALGGAPASGSTAPATEADRLTEHYRRIGEAQGHVFGEGAPGTKPPDFNLKLGEQSSQPVPPATAPQASRPTGQPPAPASAPATPESGTTAKPKPRQAETGERPLAP